MKQFYITVAISFFCLGLCSTGFAQQQLPSERPPTSWLPPQAAARLAQQKQAANAPVLPSQRAYPFGVKSLEGKKQPQRNFLLHKEDEVKLPSNSKTIRQDLMKKRKKINQ